MDVKRDLFRIEEKMRENIKKILAALTIYIFIYKSPVVPVNFLLVGRTSRVQKLGDAVAIEAAFFDSFFDRSAQKAFLLYSSSRR